MFERFTQEARQVVVHAEVVARELRHDHVGTEHLLLACFTDPEIAAGKALTELGLTADAVRERVVAIVGVGDEEPSPAQLPFTPVAKKALELALREALRLRHNDIESLHLLLALVRVNDRVLMGVLAGAGVTAGQVREAAIAMLPAQPGRRGPGKVVAMASRARDVAACIGADAAFTFTAVPDESLREALRAAALRALGDGREEFSIEDLRAVLDEKRPAA